MDDAYIGGARSGRRKRGATGKTPFVAAIATTDDAKSLMTWIDPLRLDGARPIQGPSLRRAPVRRDRRGIRVIRAARSARLSSVHTLSFEANASPFLAVEPAINIMSCVLVSAWVNEVGNAPLARIIELTDLCAAARACALVRLRHRVAERRAVDAEGEVLDVLVQSKRNKHAALKLMRKLLKNPSPAEARLLATETGLVS